MGLLDKFKKTPAPLIIGAVAKGNAILMADIPDPAFTQGFVGTCCGIEPEDGKVFAPVDGTISQVADSLHAVGIESDGMELLIHCGIDTGDMKGQGFTVAVKPGQQVNKGDALLTMDLEAVKGAGHPTTIITAVTNSDDLGGVEQVKTGPVQAGDDVLKVTLKKRSA